MLTVTHSPNKGKVLSWPNKFLRKGEQLSSGSGRLLDFAKSHSGSLTTKVISAHGPTGIHETCDVYFVDQVSCVLGSITNRLFKMIASRI